MTLGLYTIWDKVAESVQGGVHVFPHDAVAIRFFRDIMDAPDTSLAKHPEDYELHCVGSFLPGADCVRSEPSRVLLTGAALVAARSQEAGK